MLKRLLIIISVVFNGTFLLHASSVDSVRAFANNRFYAGDYDLAVKEYLRLYHFGGESDPGILMRLGDSYYHLGDWRQARLYYEQVYRNSSDEELIKRARFKKISSLILEKSYNQALIDLYNIPDSLYRKHLTEVDMLYAICHFGLEDFEKSELSFKHAVGEDEDAIARIDSIFDLKKYFNKPKPGIASTLSLIIPGSGQVYSGDISDGINSFILTGAFLVLASYVAFEYTLMDAIVIALPWYQRYYMGGINNASEAAIAERQSRRSYVYKMLLDTVKESETKKQ